MLTIQQGKMVDMPAFPLLLSFKMSVDNQFMTLQTLGQLSIESNDEPIDIDAIKSKLKETGYFKESTIKPLKSILDMFVKLDLIGQNGLMYIPKEGVKEYSELANQGDNKAALRLQEYFEKAWFFQALKPVLQEKPFLPEKEAKALLLEARSMPSVNNDSTMLTNTITFLEKVGLITKVGSNIKLAKMDEDAIDEQNTKSQIRFRELLFEKQPNSVSIKIEYTDINRLTVQDINDIDKLLFQLQEKKVLDVSEQNGDIELIYKQ